MVITNRDDAISLIEEIKQEEFQPCLAFTSFIKEQVHNTLIYFEEGMFKILEINEESESVDDDKELLLDDDGLAQFILDHLEDVNELLKNHAQVEWQEKVRKRTHLKRVK